MTTHMPRLHKLFEDLVGTSVGDENANLFDEGLIDSLLLLELVDSIEKEFNLLISAEKITSENFESLKQIDNLISSELSS